MIPKPSNARRGDPTPDFGGSHKLQARFHTVIPGGAHTYAKGDDQFPEHMAPYLVRGKGCHVWDVDGNEFIEFGSGLRSVTLGHAHPAVVEAAAGQMRLGNNFVRPSPLELDTADELLSVVPAAEMVKFGKNGSDITSAALRLSRAYTGRNRVAICGDHPFFSVDDWFIGATPMSAGIPTSTTELTVKFRYNDIASLRELFDRYPGEIACLFMEPEKEVPPLPGFLQEVKELCARNGTVLVFDEMICGFRWHLSGGQGFHRVNPDLSAFGKALGNGFSVSALAGRREIMQLGGYEHDRDRVFLLSLTHGAELPGLAAAREVIHVYKHEPVIETLWRQGERLAAGVDDKIRELGLGEYFGLLGRPCCLVYFTRDEQRNPSQAFRTLFLQETIRRGVIAPSLVVNYSHSDADIDSTVEVIGEALVTYQRALEGGIDKFLEGRPVRPTFRRRG
ncbi:MAG: glutamate-1-semialdehyde 2,1-aminomutase [Armatimonadetes bacterium]|nr:glutamate-1-semialdehyde 2,1-aminomutase [Armatimonadota bacterium]